MCVSQPPAATVIIPIIVASRSPNPIVLATVQTFMPLLPRKQEVNNLLTSINLLGQIHAMHVFHWSMPEREFPASFPFLLCHTPFLLWQSNGRDKSWYTLTFTYLLWEVYYVQSPRPWFVAKNCSLLYHLK